MPTTQRWKMALGVAEAFPPRGQCPSRPITAITTMPRPSALMPRASPRTCRVPRSEEEEPLVLGKKVERGGKKREENLLLQLLLLLPRLVRRSN